MRKAAVVALSCLAFSTLLGLGAACTASSQEEDADSSESELAAYRVQVSTAGAVTAGSNAQLSIRVLGANNTPVTQFDDLHTQVMHVVGVSSDLQDFIHVHPTLAPNGTLSVSAPIGRAQPYKFFFEYDPKGAAAGQQTSRASLRPVGAQNVAPALASSTNIFDGSRARTSNAGTTTRVEMQRLADAMIMPGMETTLRVAVKTSTGAAATDLVEWLGMPGHAIILSEDTSTFIHAHAMHPTAPSAVDGGAASSSSGGGHGGHGGHGGGGSASDAGSSTATSASNILDIDVTFPRAGLYKVFVQTKRADTVITAPFVVRVMDHG